MIGVLRCGEVGVVERKKKRINSWTQKSPGHKSDRSREVAVIGGSTV